MYSADGIGRQGHRLLALLLLAVGALGLVLVISQIGMPPVGYLMGGLAAMALAVLLLTISLWTVHRPLKLPVAKPSAAKVPTPSLDTKRRDSGDTLFDYEADSPWAAQDLNDMPDEEFEGVVPRATVVDERPPAPPVPSVVQTRHDFTAKYTQSTPQVREILTHAGPQRPPRVTAELANPSMHPSKLPPRTMRGKCGDCDTLLLAPTQRPVELACPSCGRVTLLE